MQEKSLTKNAVFKIILNICNIIVPIIIGPYILRILDRGLYDTFNKINADFQFFLVLGALGVYNYGVREISKIREDKEKCRSFFTELMLIGIVSNFLAIGVYIGFSFFMAKDNLELMLYLIMTVQFLGNMFNFEWINEANENYGFIAIKSILVRLLYLALIFVLVRQSNDIVWYVVLLMGSTVLNTFLSFVYIKTKYKFQFKNLHFKRHLKPLLLIFIIANITLLYTQLDKIMLGNLVGNHEVTAYQIPQFIASLIYSLFIPVVIVAVPRFCNLLGKGETEAFLRIYKKIVKIFLMIAIPAFTGLALLSKEIIYIYGGTTYSDCIVPLSLFALAQFAACGNYLLGDAMLYVNGKEKNLVFINIIGGIVNLVLNFILYAFHILTASTAIITLIIAYMIVNIICYIYVKRNLKFSLNIFNRNIILYVLTSLCFIPIVMGIKFLQLPFLLMVILSVTACAIFYLLALILFKDSCFKTYWERIKNRFKKV